MNHGDTTVRVCDVRTKAELNTLAGHRSVVGVVEFSADGKWIATSEASGTIKLWSAADWHEKGTLFGHHNVVMALAFSPDGRTLASACRDGVIRIWDVESRSEVAALRGHSGWVNRLAFFPDGQRIASTGEDQTLKIWNVPARSVRPTFQQEPILHGHATFSPNGQFLATLGADEPALRLWHAESGELIAALPGSPRVAGFSHGVPGDVEMVSPLGPGFGAFSSDSRLFAAGGQDCAVHLWNASNGGEVAAFSLGTNRAAAVAFTRSGELLAAAHNEEIIRRWDLQTRQSRPIWKGYEGGVGGLLPSPDGGLLAVWCRDGNIRLRDLVTEQELSPIPHDNDVPNIDFSPDGTLLVTPWLKTPDEVCGLKLWKVPTLELVENVFPDELSPWSAEFLPDGRHLLIGTFYGELMVWDMQKREIIQTIKEYNSGINTISVAAGAKVFATASHEQRVSLWDSATRKVVARFRGHTGSVWASALSPDGTVVATGSSDGTTKLWDGTARDSALIEHGSLIAGFSRDSRTLVLAPREGDYRWHLLSPAHSTVEIPAEPPLRSDFIQRPYDVFGDAPIGVLGRIDGSVEFWDLAARKQIASWSAGSNSITAATFSPDGTHLATGDVAAQIKVWSVATREELAAFRLASPALPAVGAPVSTLVFSPGGKTLAAAAWPSALGDVVLWNLVTKRETLRLTDQKYYQ
jgi:WD40 repeat protein